MGITPKDRERIIRWLTSDMELSGGRALIAELHPNKRLARNSSHMDVKTVEYELKVLLDIPKTAIFGQKCNNKELLRQYGREIKSGPSDSRKTQEVHAARPAQERKEEKARPRVPADDHLLLQAKEAVAELGVEASKIHTALFETGEMNSEKHTRLRSEMLERLRTVTDLKEAIWKEKEDYCDTGVASQRLKDLVEAYYAKGESGDSAAGDMSSKDTAWLVKRKENVRKYITKCRNRLEYGTKTAQAVKNPMPQGPERAKTVERMNAYIMELELINKELERRTDK
jgi:polyhydroxyalkanoate synthesis regulator phasin